MKHLRNMWFLMVKDLKIFASDRAALIFSILFPFFFIVLFNFVMTGTNGQDTRLVISLATNEPAGGISNQIIAAMVTQDPAALKPGQPEIVWLKDYNQAMQDVKDNKLDGFIAFPANFTEAVTTGYGTDLEIIYNPNNQQTVAPLQGMAQGIAADINAREVVDKAVIGIVTENAGSISNPSQL
ncbi:MAG TPA: ABC transporter permease, partial [Dehalococcoidales bacterium]|nr:ABC transporter permease [Dehalococcoidales bacterium]